MKKANFIFYLLVISTLIGCKSLKKNCDCPSFSEQQNNSEKKYTDLS
jgi:hypothetical protein